MVTVPSKLAGSDVQVTKDTLAQPYLGVTPLVNGSGNQANAVATATLTPSAATCAYLCGFAVTGCGATIPLPVIVTVSGLLGGTRNFIYSFSDAPKQTNHPLIMHFDPPLPGAGVSQAIVVSCPPSGTGGTHNVVFAHGFSTTVPVGVTPTQLPG